MDWYLKVIKNYVVFEGRARRKEYWMFYLFNSIFAVILIGIGVLLHLSTLLESIYSLAILLPSLAVGTRRLHDIGKTGWWQLISLIPIVGAIVLIVFWCQDSQPNENKFGLNPKLS